MTSLSPQVVHAAPEVLEERVANARDCAGSSILSPFWLQALMTNALGHGYTTKNIRDAVKAAKTGAKKSARVLIWIAEENADLYDCLPQRIPHQYRNHEVSSNNGLIAIPEDPEPHQTMWGFRFRRLGTNYREYLLKSGSAWNGGKPVADRMVLSGLGMVCGMSCNCISMLDCGVFGVWDTESDNILLPGCIR